MNIVTRILNGKSKKENETIVVSGPTTTTIDDVENDTTPPIDLFIDNEVPVLSGKGDKETPNQITAFLNRDNRSTGINDGYEYHSQEALEIGKKKIKSEFQFIVDQSIQDKIQKHLQVKNLIVEVGQIAKSTKETLENTAEALISSIDTLQSQKELSSENEGWVMKAVNSYHQGFIQGLNDFISGEDLLNSINNI